MIDVFKVGVHIGMTSNSSQVLALMLRELTGIHGAVGNLEQKLGTMRSAVLAAGAAFVGFKGLEVMTHLLGKGIAFNQELAKMKMANFDPGDVKSLESQAYKTMNAVPGTNLTDALKGLVDLRNVSGSSGHAVELSESIARLNAVLANVSGKPAEAAGFKFIKFLEDAGLMIDPKTGQFSEEKVKHESRWMEAVIAATNGRVDGDAMFQLRQSGKASVNSLSEQGRTNLVPHIMSLGPVAVGTGIQGMTQQLLGSVQLYAHTIQWLNSHHMVDMKKVHKQKGGRYSLDAGAITGEEQLKHDPAGWITDQLSRHMLNKDGSEMSLADKIDEVKRSGMRVTAQGIITEGIQNEVTQKKEVGNINRANKIDQFDVMNAESPTFRVMKFTEAWENLQIALGKTVDVTMFLVPLTDALNRLNAIAVDHPDGARLLIEIVSGLAALTLLSGGLKLLGIALGPLATGLSLLCGVPGLAAAGGLISSVAGGLSALIAPIAAIAGILKLGSDSESPENRTKIEQNRKGLGHGLMPDVGDGFGPDGVPLAPKSGDGTGKRSGDVYLDGKKVGMIIMDHTANSLSRAPTGRSGADMRVSPMMPGMSTAFG